MKARIIFLTVILLLVISSCGSPSTSQEAIPISGPESTDTPEVGIAVTAVQTVTPASTEPVSAGVTHKMEPSNSPPGGPAVRDVVSVDTAPEKRAPYGDSYKINLYERPFLKDMIYVPDLDIVSYSVSSDQDWYYVSLALVGRNPNNKLGIDYAVEVDLDKDGFGDYIIWGHPPYNKEWSTGNVQVFADQNHDTSGLSSIKADTSLAGDGYETLIFDGSVGGDDPDLAWVRMNAGPSAQIQFAFKKSLANPPFMLGVLADGGLKDVTRMDYNDHISVGEAGSPVRDNSNYPLQSLFAVDNVCRVGIGFSLSGNEPQGCPVDTTNRKRPQESVGATEAPACPPPPGCIDWDPVACVCNG